MTDRFLLVDSHEVRPSDRCPLCGYRFIEHLTSRPFGGVAVKVCPGRLDTPVRQDDRSGRAQA